MSDALADADLASEMAQLVGQPARAAPGLDQRARSGMQPGGRVRWATATRSRRWPSSPTSRRSSSSWPRATPARPWTTSTSSGWSSSSAPPRRATCEALRQLERELERQGYLSRGDDGLRLTPRAVRRLGETALKRVFDQLDASGRGDHDDQRTGQADEPTGLTRPWVFGDELPLDAVAHGRQRAAAAAGLPSGGVQLMVEDFEVVETERRTTAAVALCVDMSFSMVQEGRWGPMKQTALALSHLVETRFRQDALQIIGFNLAARRLTPVQLADVEPEWVQGTNLQHALMLAARHLRRHPDAEPVVLVVTDGEPTAHIGDDGVPDVPAGRPPSETLRATVAQVDELTRYGATLNVFMLGEDPGLARFVDAIARRAGGRVFTPDLGRLGEYVVADYLRARRGRR